MKPKQGSGSEGGGGRPYSSADKERTRRFCKVRKSEVNRLLLTFSGSARAFNELEIVEIEEVEVRRNGVRN